MRLSGMGQLAVAVKKSLETLTFEDHSEDEEKDSPVLHNRYVDSVEFSDRAIELFMQADTEKDSNEQFDKGFKKESDTDQGQEEADTNRRQEPAFTGAISLNILA